MDINALKAEMVKKGYTQATLATELGITPRTFSNRLKKQEFGSKEIQVMMKVLDIKDPMEIFFT